MPEQPPGTIYLQWESLNEIWLAVRTDPGDIEYIRADVHRGIIADLLAACRAAYTALGRPYQRAQNDGICRRLHAIIKAWGAP